MRTYSPKAAELEHRWWVVDAEGQILGRLASAVAGRLRGKDKPGFAPHLDVGDFVVVVNAAKVRVTGRKLEQKRYTRHSGYPGGLRVTPLADQLQKHPERVIEAAVRGMLPKNALGHQLLQKLKVYPGPQHPHAAQQPQTWTLTPDTVGGSEA
jgi:large subunit ribosomal protein L13